MSSTDPINARHINRVGNPAPLGLFSFASTNFILSMYIVQARHIFVPNVFVGMALAVGGLIQLLAGQWDLARGNTFGGTVYSSYGGFWLSLALVYMPGTGIMSAYAHRERQLFDAMGIFFITWFIATFLFLVASLRTNIASIALFGFLSITFILLSAGQMANNNSVSKAGGVFGMVTSLVAYYAGAAQLFNKHDSYLVLPVGRLDRET
ncbi:hypothetical protein M422DRAFT_57771 [Sphaerobolus stellatus SS14]|nr:hypothetical protein M422DRAFT_57771 [Sphaerobolus stellatus SS14]